MTEKRFSAGALSVALGLEVYPLSIVVEGKALFFLARRGVEKFLCTAGVSGFGGEGRRVKIDGEDLSIKISPTTHENAVLLRKHLSWTAPAVCGIRLSVGCGDRLGLATPGHIRAVRGTGAVPFLAQQSIREMDRTMRSPEEVMDCATWGVFQEGWRGGFGSDADHLKSAADIDRCVGAGFTLFTIDPGDHVENSASGMGARELAAGLAALPWEDLATSQADSRARFAGKSFNLPGGVALRFTEEDYLRAAAKYARAVAHTAKMAAHLGGAMGRRPFELEMSVDETQTPTTAQEHFYVASELARLGVKQASLAPRFVGRFEKGVDYQGDIAEFEREFAKHVAIARHLGPYKISLHSGSDKFSIYDVVATETRGLVHLKTAGTSYLEALRAVAEVSPALFRGIYAYSRERYGEDRASYHVSAQVERTPAPDAIGDKDLVGLLDDFDVRQVLHVTFGSVLTSRAPDGALRFAPSMLALLRQHPEAYAACLERHFVKHLRPFASVAAAR